MIVAWENEYKIDFHVHGGEEDMSGHNMVGQAGPGTLPSGDGNDSTHSQLVLGVINVHVDVIVL